MSEELIAKLFEDIGRFQERHSALLKEKRRLITETGRLNGRVATLCEERDMFNGLYAECRAENARVDTMNQSLMGQRVALRKEVERLQQDFPPEECSSERLTRVLEENHVLEERLYEVRRKNKQLLEEAVWGRTEKGCLHQKINKLKKHRKRFQAALDAILDVLAERTQARSRNFIAEISEIVTEATHEPPETKGGIAEILAAAEKECLRKNSAEAATMMETLFTEGTEEPQEGKGEEDGE